MLERFKVPEKDRVHVRHDRMRGAVDAIFLKMGQPPEDAALSAEVLVSTPDRLQAHFSLEEAHAQACPHMPEGHPFVPAPPPAAR